MNRKRNLAIIVSVLVLLSVLISGFIYMQPSAEEILTTALETLEAVESGHAVVSLQVNGSDHDGSAELEIWGRHAADGPGAFRVEVLSTSEAEGEGAVLVSDGETLWAYLPAKGVVYTGTAEEAKEMMKEREQEMDGAKHEGLQNGDFTHPETPAEAVQLLLEYFNADKLGLETISGASAYRVQLMPIPEQMPAEFAAVGGNLNLWIDRERNLPLALEYTGGSLGEFNLIVARVETNIDLDDSLFSFTIPDDVEVKRFADLRPQSLSLEEAAKGAEFEFLVPAEAPAGATLVDVMEVQGLIVQRYTLPDGGSFTVAQGVESAPHPNTEAQTVAVRGASGSAYVSPDGAQVFLTWSDGDLSYSIAGDLTLDQALVIAESLK